MGQGGLVSPVLFSPYVDDKHTPSRHVESHHADDTVLVATSRSPSPLVGCLEAYLSRLERWLRDWKIAINVSKSTAVLFVKAARLMKNRSLQFLGEPIEWVETALYLGVTLIDVCRPGKLCISTSYLVGRRQSGGKEGSSKIGRAWPLP
jgi:hypothetical protein